MKKIFTIRNLIYTVLVAVFLFSSYKVFLYFSEGKEEKTFHKALMEDAVTKHEPVQSERPIDSILPEEEEFIPLLTPDLSVDVAKLKKKYSSIVGWLYLPNSPIHYPVVQGEDNLFFVDHLPSGAQNPAGSLFLDFRDLPDLSGFNQVIYGHNMLNGSMFGTILDYRDPNYFKTHPYLFYFTESKTYRLEVFAGVNTYSTSELYERPSTPEAKETYLQSVRSRSTFISDVSVSAEDQILVLSTCSGAVGDTHRYVIFAKIVDLGI